MPRPPGPPHRGCLALTGSFGCTACPLTDHPESTTKSQRTNPEQSQASVAVPFVQEFARNRLSQTQPVSLTELPHALNGCLPRRFVRAQMRLQPAENRLQSN